MTLDQLRVLVSIADTGSVLAAAQALHRTQPTLSVAIRKLEEEIGVKILTRDSYRATLTPEGKKLYQQARTILKQAENFSTLARHMALGNEPEIRIAIEASCPMPLILKIMKDCEKKFIQTEFSFMLENIWGAMERLLEDDADLAICPWFEDNLSLESFPFDRTSLITVATPDFEPARGKKELLLEDLKDAVQVIVKDSSLKPIDRSYGVIDDGRHWLVNDHLTKKQILLAGMGWGRLQEHLIRDELETGALVPLNIKNYPNTIHIEIRVARKLDQPAGPVAEALWHDLKQLSPLIS